MHVVFGTILSAAHHIRFHKSVRRQTVGPLCILNKLIHRKEMPAQRNEFPELLLDQKRVAQQKGTAVVDLPTNTRSRQQVVNRICLVQKITDVPWMRSRLPTVGHVTRRSRPCTNERLGKV